MKDTLESNIDPEASSAGLDEEVFFKNMTEAFDRAISANPEDLYQSYYRLAGKLIRLRVVGRELMRYTGLSLSHLQTSEPTNSEPRLTIELWDENITGVPCPDKSNAYELSETWIMRLRRPVHLIRSSNGRFIYYHHEGCITCLDKNKGHIVGWRSWKRGICMDEYADPISLLLYAWYSDQGVHVIHAGLVSRNGQGVLFAGPRWSGKSTSALSCLCAGLDYLGDDRVGLQKLGDGSFVGHSIYNSTQLEPENLPNFPSLIPHAIPGAQKKDRVVIHLAEIFPGRIRRFAPIRAIALPRIANSLTPKLQPAPKGQALLALTPSASLMPFTPRADCFYSLAHLVQQVPVYWLDVTNNSGETPSQVHQILSEVRG